MGFILLVGISWYFWVYFVLFLRSIKLCIVFVFENLLFNIRVFC